MLFLKQSKFGRPALVLLLLVLILALVGFAPIAQGVQRFTTILTQNITVSNSATFNAPTDFNNTVDFSEATVTGVSTSTLSSLTVTGDSVLSGTLAVTGATTMVGALGADGGLTVDSSAFTVADTSGNTQIAGTLGVTGATTLTGNTDVVGTLQYGTANLYPLGYGSVNQQVVCGTTATFTETLEVTPTGLTTVTYVIASQITTPAAGAVFLTVSDPTTSTFTLSSWESDYTAGTTGIEAHYCAVGDQ